MIVSPREPRALNPAIYEIWVEKASTEGAVAVQLNIDI